MWYFTGIKLHATKSIDIMNVWLSTLKSVNSSCTPCHPLSRTPPNSTDICFYLDLDKQLASSLGPFLMTNAAETIRYTSAGWTTSGIESFSMMLLDVFYPVLNDFSGGAVRGERRDREHEGCPCVWRLHREHDGVRRLPR